jgi:hypothetical protein
VARPPAPPPPPSPTPGCVESIEFSQVRAAFSPLVPEGAASAEFLVVAVRDSPTLFYFHAGTYEVSRVGLSEDSGTAVRGSDGASNAGYLNVGFAVLDLAASPDGAMLAAATDHGLIFLLCPGTSTIMRCGLVASVARGGCACGV